MGRYPSHVRRKGWHIVAKRCRARHGGQAAALQKQRQARLGESRGRGLPRPYECNPPCKQAPVTTTGTGGVKPPLQNREDRLLGGAGIGRGGHLLLIDFLDLFEKVIGLFLIGLARVRARLRVRLLPEQKV